MKLKVSVLFLLLFVTACLFNNNNNQILDDEKLIYSVIIDSVFNESYEVVFIEDSSRSINRYIQKNLFSESLFGQEIEEYYKSFYKKKKCNMNEDLVKEFININRSNLFFPKKYFPKRDHKYATYTSIYFYINGGNRNKNELLNTADNGTKLGIISFSRAGFNSDKTEALVEVNIYRLKKGELVFINLNKVNNKWGIKSSCYMHGPYKID